jgi:hypothetical protein
MSYLEWGYTAIEAATIAASTSGSQPDGTLLSGTTPGVYKQDFFYTTLPERHGFIVPKLLGDQNMTLTGLYGGSIDEWYLNPVNDYGS